MSNAQNNKHVILKEILESNFIDQYYVLKMRKLNLDAQE